MTETEAAGAPAVEEPKEMTKEEMLKQVIGMKFGQATFFGLYLTIMFNGLKQLSRSVWQKNAYDDDANTTAATAISDSNVAKAYKYMAYTQLPIGMVGFSVFMAKKYMKENTMLRIIAYYLVLVNGGLGLSTFLATIYKSTSRQKCSEEAVWQCHYDSSPTDANKWSNGAYGIQTVETFVLGLQQMFFTYMFMDKFALDAKMAKEEKAKADEKASDEKDTSDSTATDESTSLLEIWSL